MSVTNQEIISNHLWFSRNLQTLDFSKHHLFLGRQNTISSLSTSARATSNIPFSVSLRNLCSINMATAPSSTESNDFITPNPDALSSNHAISTSSAPNEIVLLAKEAALNLPIGDQFPATNGPLNRTSAHLEDLLSSEDGQKADAIIARLPAYRAENKKATWWGFYKHIEGNTYVCQTCSPLMSNLSSKDKKDRKGFVRYSSAGGASSLRRHVEEHHKSSHENVRKRLREKGVLESEYPK